MHESTLFKASCFSYTAVGIELLMLGTLLVPLHGAPRLHKAVSWLFVAQGVLSYMADVVSFGHSGPWKAADKVAALVLVPSTVVVLGCSIAGWVRLPLAVIVAWTVCVAIAAHSKLRASALLVEGHACPEASPHQWMRQHIIWHAAPAIFGAVLLVALPWLRSQAVEAK